MAAYSYKDVVYRTDFQDAIEPAMIACLATRADYDGDANYNGDCWVVAAYLLEQKDARIAELDAAHNALETAARSVIDMAERARMPMHVFRSDADVARDDAIFEALDRAADLLRAALAGKASS